MSYTPNDKPKLALLIDADNISAKYLSTILNEIPRHGIATYRRIYGDFTDSQMASWRKQLLDNSIQPVQQFSNVKSHKKGEKAGKNATDSTLIIDAMDILYAGKVDGFIIVSSDSDFTRLAQRLRESNMLVVGMGRNQTSISFRHACTKFVNIESLYDMANGKKQERDAADAGDSDDIETTVTLKDVEIVIAGIIRDNDNNGRTTTLAEIGASLNNKFPDFDVRNFGYTQLSKMIEEFRRFDMTRTEVGYDVSIRRTDVTADKVLEFIVSKVAERRNKTMSISALAGAVYEEYPDFNIKDEGYSQFYKFAGSAPELTIMGNSSRRLARIVDQPEQAETPEEQNTEAGSTSEQAPAAEPEKPAGTPEAAESKQEEAAESAKPARRRRRRSSHKVENAAEETAEAQAEQAAEPKQEEQPAANEQAEAEPAEQPAEEQVTEEQPPAEKKAEKKAAKQAAEKQPAAKKTRRKTKSSKAKDEAKDTQKPVTNYSEIYAFMVSELEKAKENTMGMAPLATKVKKRFPEFDLASTGYKQFFQFANNCLEITIVGEGRGRKATLSK